jgi:RNA polymerase subunit RPABC4/transcription elongation factor Spt4
MSTDALTERMRLIRFRMRRERTRFSDEIRIVPRKLVWIVIVLWAVAVVVGMVTNLMGAWEGHEVWPEGVPTGWAMLATVGVVTAAAIPLACLIFLVGYVHQDARRRGMNAGLCTFLVLILLPAWIFIGFVIYFLVREPLPYHCTQCGAMVSARFNFCPACRCNLRPTCPQCKREISERDHYCPYCGGELAMAADPVPGPVAG